MVTLKKTAFCLVCIVSLSSVKASPVSFTVENLSPAQTVTSNVSAARTSFITNLASSVQSYGFENAALNATAPLNVSFAGSGGSTIAATMQGGGSVKNANGGRFNTTAGGSKFWQAQAADPSSSTVGNFSISFGTAISAFGFYGTDIGDFEGTLSLVLVGANGTQNETLVVGNTAGAASGSLLFFGFYDLTGTYSAINFLSSSPTGTDYFGFDDFLVADRGQITAVIPEPTSLALTGLALAAAGFAARRARRIPRA